VFTIYRNTKKNEFEDLYLKVREKENRFYSDKILKNLPDIKTSHPLFYEWKIRKASLKKFEEYIKSKDTLLNIMELGCGNGWLTHRLAAIRNCYVIGVDINKFELEQAARVFNSFNNHKFFYTDIFADYFELGDFDIIILASSVQYFRNIDYLMERLFYFLKRNSEIHIIDSPIYNSSDILKAQGSTEKYYEKISFREMSKFYFHHSFKDLEIYDPIFLYNRQKQSFYSILFKNSDSPFPWIMIKK